MTRDTLIERLEAADGPDRELMGRAFIALNPTPRDSFDALKAHSAKGLRFKKMLDAEAYESAALALVDLSNSTLSLSIGATNLALVTVMQDDPRTEPPCFDGAGATPALAIVIAALKAGAEQ